MTEGRGEPFDVDADPMNADWPKVRTWDLPTEPRAFLSTIGAVGSLAEQRERLASFMKLPAAIPMPSGLREVLIREGLL